MRNTLHTFLLVFFAIMASAAQQQLNTQNPRMTNCPDLEQSKKMGDMMYAGAATCLTLTANPNSQKQGMAILKSEAEKGNEHAITSLASKYLMGAEGFEKNIPEGLRLLEAGVKQGSKKAKAMFGSMLLHGQMVDKDSIRGETLMREAADGGDPGAQYNLFIAYRRGDEIPKSLVLSETYWKLLNSNNDPFAPRVIEFGQQYLAREAKDTEKLLERAQAGDVGAQYTLAKLYVDLRKYEDAVKWLQAAVDQNSVSAMIDLANMHDQSLGVSKDPELAASLLRRAAELGYPAAQYLLADKYFHGIGVEKSPASALFWLRVAELLGSEKAADSFRSESKQQPAEMLNAVDAKAKAYIQMHPEFIKQPDGKVFFREITPAVVQIPPKKD